MSRHCRRAVACLLVAGFVASAGGAPAQQPPRPGQVDDRRLLAANDATDADWITFGQDYRNQRFSSLTGIGRGNVGRLAPAWIYQTGVVGSTQTQPLVVDGTMYITTPGNDLAAVNAATGEQIWRYAHKFANELPRAPSNRGAAVGYGRVYQATDDRRMIALDQATGKVVWDKTIQGFDASALLAPGRGAGQPVPFVMRMPPLVYDGMVIAGATGFEVSEDVSGAGAGGDPGLAWIQANLGRRAFIVALDAATGAERWRWYTTKEDGWEGEFVANAPDGTPLNRDVTAERALAARYKNAWAAGSGSPWATPAVDPGAGLIFVGTGNPAPGNVDLVRPGDNLYTNGVAALEARTGKLRWFFQLVPHEQWSSDASGQTFLFDATMDGRTVAAVGICGKTGWCHAIDRATGKLLFKSDPVVPQVNRFSPATREGILVAPGGAGGVGVSPISYDVNTGLAYVGAIHRPTRMTRIDLPPVDGLPALGMVKTESVPLSEAWGTVSALDLRNRGKLVWQVKLPQPQVGGTLATAGGLIFAGEANGRFGAYDAATGALLWSFQTGANVGAPPMAYAVNGRQYVAVATGAAAPAPGASIVPGAPRPGGSIIAFAVAGP